MTNGHEDIIEHIVISKENLLAAQAIYKSYHSSIHAAVLRWTDDLLVKLQQEEKFASWENATKRDTSYPIARIYACACWYTPLLSETIGTCIEFQKIGAQDPVIGIWLHPRLDDRPAIIEAFKKENPDIPKNSNNYWACYNYLPNPYKNWLEDAELVEELYNQEQPMLYDRIRDYCAKVQKFIDSRLDDFPQLKSVPPKAK